MSTQVTEIHKGLHDFQGKWKVEQKQWTGPSADPVTHHGHCDYTVILGGLAAQMHVSIKATNFEGMGLLSYNVEEGRLEMSWVDTLSREGIISMYGQPEKKLASPAILKAFSSTATQEREWSTSCDSACVEPRVLAAAASNVSVTRLAGAPAPQTVPMRLVENKISADHWVLDFFLPGPQGEFLAQQNSFTRA